MGDSDIVKEFLVESYENLDRLDRDLIALEKEPGNREILASVFRTIHTIKGTSGFLAFNQLEKVTHVGENLLSRLRDGQLSLNPEITTGLLAMVDAVRQMLGSIEASGNEGERQDGELIATLTRLQQGGAAPPKIVEAPPASSAEPPTISEPKAASPPKAEVTLIRETEKTPPPRIVDVAQEATAAKAPEKIEATPTGPAQSASDSTIRVDVSLLDQLMNLVGELVLARNQILQFTNSTEETGLLGTSQRLNLITTELQEGVMKTRMQPINNIWSKFPRTVRDVALGCGKQVRIEMEGKETELDKTIIEAIKDPLTHLVRNAVDHGIEAPAARQATGKDPEGVLCLRAFHEGGQVNIEISDDGAGLDLEKIRNKAIQKGLLSSEQAARMTEREVTNLIFLPGFSTSEKVTNVSGRGVGMDVVKTNIEKIGGTVDVQSTLGKGSTVRMKIPLTLAIIPALIVSSAGNRYAIPQVSLLELVRLEGDEVRQGIEEVKGAPVHRLRGHLLPLVFLNRELEGGDRNAQSVLAQLAAKAEMLDFGQARQKHLDWLKRLRGVLEGTITLSSEQTGSHKECALGKWIYGTGLTHYRYIPEMVRLEATHEIFHRTVRETVTLKEAGNTAQAEQERRKVEDLSKKIVDMLTAVEKKVVESQNVNIVVLQADDQQFGLVVDEINDTEEIVVKPLSKQLKSINTYAGATIMGDGRVALILDVLGLAQRANVIGVRDHALAEKEAKSTASDHDKKRHPMLLVRHGEQGRLAIDLDAVARLEEFPRDTIEVAGGRETVQYRGQIMPLVRLSELLGASGSETATRDSLQVVVYSDRGRSVGLVVDLILDIVEELFAIERHTGRQGVMGAAVIQKRITDILDLPALMEMAQLGEPSAQVQP